MSDVTLHLGDCLDVMRSMPDGCVDACISDPPYGVDYADWDGDVPPQAVLSECLRISRGPVVWFGAADPACLAAVVRYQPPPERTLVWAPAFSLAQSRASRIFFRFHLIWCWRMPEKQDAISSDVLRHNCEGRHWWNHPATKPLALMRDLVRAFTPDSGSALDPFMGSGTTGVACLREGRSFIGIEREPEYHAIAEARIAHARGEVRPDAEQRGLDFGATA